MFSLVNPVGSVGMSKVPLALLKDCHVPAAPLLLIGALAAPVQYPPHFAFL